MRPMIEIAHLSKRFGSIEAVRDLSFTVREGELFAFLGINGAGKSTTISILCGRLRQDAGEVRIDGKSMEQDKAAVKSKLGVVFQNSVLDKALTVFDNLCSRAALYGITGTAFRKRLDALDGLLELKPLLRRPVGKLSGGQRRRADIARALLHDSPVYIFDEATSNIDVESENDIMAQIHALAGRKTVLLISHRLANVTASDEIYVLERGNIVQHGTHEALLKQGGAYAALWSAQQVLEHYGEEAAK